MNKQEIENPICPTKEHNDSDTVGFNNTCEYCKNNHCMATQSEWLNFICSLFEVNALDNKNMKP